MFLRDFLASIVTISKTIAVSKRQWMKSANLLKYSSQLTRGMQISCGPKYEANTIVRWVLVLSEGDQCVEMPVMIN